MAEAAVLTPTSSPPITTVDESGWWTKGLVYSPPGGGKTYLGCTMPDPLILLTEGDVAKPTILKAQRDLGKQIKIWHIRSLSDLIQAYAYIRDKSKEPDFPFKSVVLDIITDMNRMVLEEVLGTARLKKSEHDPDILDRQDWNRVEGRMRRVLRMFRDLDMHVLMLALVMEPMEGMKAPSLQPKKLSLDAAALFNWVAYLGKTNHPETEQEVRVLVFGGDPSFIGKNPGGMVDNYVMSPNMTEIIKKLHGRVKSKG